MKARLGPALTLAVIGLFALDARAQQGGLSNGTVPLGGSALDSPRVEPGGELLGRVTHVGVGLSYRGLLRYRDPARASQFLGDLPSLQVVTAMFSLRHSFGYGWLAEIGLPVSSIRIEPGYGEPSDRHTGIGDLGVGARYDLAAMWGTHRPSLTLGFSIGIPTGQHLQDRVHADGHAHGGSGDPSRTLTRAAITLSEGTFSVTGHACLTHFLDSDLAVELRASARSPLGLTETGLRYGGLLTSGLGFIGWAHPFALAARARYETWARTFEQGRGFVTDSGGSLWVLEADLSVMFSPRWNLVLTGRAPMYTDVDGDQVAESYGVELAIVLSLGGTD